MKKTVVKNVDNLTPRERRVCIAMSYKDDGLMKDWILRPYNGTKVVLVYEDDLVVGWGVRNPGGFSGFWTRRSHRNRGIGSKMVKRLEKIGPLIVAPHDERSTLFFQKNNQTNWR